MSIILRTLAKGRHVAQCACGNVYETRQNRGVLLGRKGCRVCLAGPFGGDRIARNKALKVRKALAGECNRCPAKAAPNRSECESCAEKSRRQWRAWRARKVAAKSGRAEAA